MCISTKCDCFSSKSLSKIAHPPSSKSCAIGFGFVVWTTDSDSVDVRPLISPVGAHAMSHSDGRRDDQMRELDCLRLASELRQLAKETLSPDLKAHCLRMAKQWSDEADERAQDDTGIGRGLG